MAKRTKTPATPSNERIDPFSEVGVSGVKRFGGIIDDEYHRDLRGRNARRIYREMSDDAVIGAALFAVKQEIKRVTFTIEDGGHSTADARAADLVRTSLNDMSATWSHTLDDILTCIEFGFSPCEIVYKRRLGQQTPSSQYNDGLIGWRKIALRRQDTIHDWIIDDSDGAVQGLRQQAPPHYLSRSIPIEKLLIFRPHNAGGNPEGRSCLRSAYMPWYIAQHISRFEAIGVERNLNGMPVLYAPHTLWQAAPGTMEAQILGELKTLVTRIKNDEQAGLLLPQAYDQHGNPMYRFELATGGSRQSLDTDRILQRLDMRKAMAVLANVLLIGTQGSTGSLALSTNMADFFEHALQGFADMIAAVFTRHAIPRLMRLNGFTLDAMPRMVAGTVGQVDLRELGEYITRLAGAGFPLFPHPGLEAHLLRIARLPVDADMEAEIGKRGAQNLLREVRKLRRAVELVRPSK